MFTLSPRSRPPLADGRSVAPYHPREVDRLGVLCAHGFEETESEPLFDRIADEAALAAGTPIAFLNVVRGDDHISVGRFGLEPGPVPRDESFCAHTIVNGALLVVPDLLIDSRFSRIGSVARAGGLRFYAGVPVADGSGLPVASLCVLDVRPRDLAPDVQGALVRLATLAGTVLDVRRLVVGPLGSASPFARAAAHDALAASFDPLLRALAELGGGEGARRSDEEPTRPAYGSGG